MALAVTVRGGFKYYGKESDKKIVLNYLNMNVEHGSIYGLLGASGCGKTTLLSCIIGIKHLQSGTLCVLGGKPGTEGSGVPGPRIGYMPQEVALVEEFTVKETIYYFGRIYGMPSEEIRDRYRFLKELLELPSGSRQVGQCSGGQQRRVSFACTLVHTPELLILDEPTVGLDPVLREKIWDYLVDATRNTKLAVLITTHYIDETKRANKIGFMRNGVLLAEDSPPNILRRFNTESLEDAFLALCMKQGVSEEAHEGAAPHTITDGNDAGTTEDLHATTASPPPQSTPTNGKVISPRENGDAEKRSVFREMHESGDEKAATAATEKRRPSLKERVAFTSKIRMKALLAKMSIQIIRQPAALVFLFVYPIFQLVCFYVAFGGDPKSLRLGIVNEEIASPMDCKNQSLVTVSAHDYECDWYKVSCRFLNAMNDSIAEQVYFSSFDEAYSQARRGKLHGILYFAKNFTESLSDRHINGQHTTDATLATSEIQVHLDKTDQQMSLFLERKLLEVYIKFAQTLMTDCQLPEKMGNVPVAFKEPIYGSFSETYTEFVAPGVIMTMIFFLATLTTSTAFINDRLEGIWNRTLVAGIKPAEMLLAHILGQSCVMLIQCFEIVFLAAVVFGTSNKGDDFTIIFLLMLLGFAGMCFGLFISIFCDTHTQANFFATGTFYPMIILCGILWPLEGMPDVLKYFAYFLPFTFPSISTRNVLTKGYPITNPSVAMGYATTILWIIGLLLLCLIGLRIKK